MAKPVRSKSLKLLELFAQYSQRPIVTVSRLCADVNLSSHLVTNSMWVANPSLDLREEVQRPEQRKSQVLLPRRHYGFLVTEGQTSNGITHYAQGGAPPSHQTPAKRQQSLPSRRIESDEKQRHVNSAPSRKNRSQSQKAPLPKINNLVAKSRGPGGETSHILTTNFAGFSTKDQEASPTRCTRFASTWAQVRAENHIDMCAPTSPEGLNKNTGQEEDKSDDRHTGDKLAARPDQTTGRSPNREATKVNSHQGKPDPAFHGPSLDKEQTRPEKYRRKDPALYAKPLLPAKEKTGEKSKKQTIRYKDLEGQNCGSVLGSSEASNEQETKSSTKRPEWNDSQALLVPYQSQTPVKSWRRYEAELTHAPTVTSTQQVFKAYTGSSKQQLQLRQMSDDNDNTFSEHRPSTRGMERERQNGEEKKPDSLAPKEYILTRNEAQMFLHLQNVYGSETYRQQRKELFFKKLTDVQLKELEHQDAEKRRKLQRIQESKRRQKRQLLYVRRKFRKEQLHRFRTQYVTSRVLEYEMADRDIYGLPTGWDEDDAKSFDDEDSFDKEDILADHRKVRDSSRCDEGSDEKKDKDVSEKRMAGHPANVFKSGKASQKSITTDKSKSVALEFKASTGSHPLDSLSMSKDKSNAADSKSTGSKNCIHVSSSQTNAKKSTIPRIITEKSKQNPNNDQDINSGALEVTEGAITSSNDNRNNSSNMASTCTDTAKRGMTAPKNMSSTTKQDPKQSKMAKKTLTSNNSNMDSRMAPVTQLSLAVADCKPVESNTPNAFEASHRAVGKPVKNSSSTYKKNASASIGTLTAPSSTDTENKASPAAISKTTVSRQQDSKTECETTEKNSENVRNNSRDDNYLKLNKNDSIHKTKNTDLKKKETDSVNSNKNDVRKDSNKEKKHDALNKSRDGRIGGNDQTTINRSNNEIHTITTKKSGVKVPSGKTTSKTVFSSDHSLNGHASDPSHEPVSSNPTVVTSTTISKDDRNKSSAARQPDFQNRKPAQPHSKNEAEQKKQFERKYGKLFEMNTGPSWNPGARPPKMEGIDTVLIRVTDKTGRTKLKKKEVKDIVKEAKAQLAQHDLESLGQAAGRPDQHTHKGIRPASADTLDFDEDENDEEEDVFERVRRKYNLQIDSDGDESIV